MLPLQLKWMSGMKHKILGTLGQRVLGSMDRGQLNLLDQFRQEGGATTKTKEGSKEEVRNVGGGGRREGRNGWPWEQGRGPLPRSNICESELNCANLILAESSMLLLERAMALNGYRSREQSVRVGPIFLVQFLSKTSNICPKSGLDITIWLNPTLRFKEFKFQHHFDHHRYT